MILLRFYKKEMDRVWFESSNVFYAECDDSSNTVYKTVRVLFKNGSCYEYSNVNVDDWLMFVLHESAGKGLNEYIIKKKYEYKRMDKALLMEELLNEYNIRMGDKTLSISINDKNEVIVADGKEKEIQVLSELTNPEEVHNCLVKTFIALGYDVIWDSSNTNEIIESTESNNE